MALKRMVLEIGMGTDIRGGDDTKAAVRALRDALWHNSLSVAAALGLDTDSMQVEVTIGTPHPEKVDKAQVLAVLPHGTGNGDGGPGRPGNSESTKAPTSTLLAQAAAVVWAGRAVEGSGTMALKRVILEMGTGNDLHGGQGVYNKAAIRAVQDGDPSQFARHAAARSVSIRKRCGWRSRSVCNSPTRSTPWRWRQRCHTASSR